MRRVALALAGLTVAAVPALALAQDPAMVASVDASTIGAIVAAAVASLVGGGAAGQWRAARTAPAPPDQTPAIASAVEAIAELRRDLRALEAVVAATREAGIRSGAQLEAMSGRLTDIHRMVERIEEAARAAR
jgi:hypothetical protein